VFPAWHERNLHFNLLVAVEREGWPGISNKRWPDMGMLIIFGSCKSRQPKMHRLSK
jgi:hypothetical protein